MLAKTLATLAKAQLDLSHTSIQATFPGTVANRTAVAGTYVEPGQALFTAVPDSRYVIANFKETEVAWIHPGQAVRVSSDAIPGQSFTGHVDSIQRGTGSNFALLPPENATGNFVKIVQRVPVKIVFDESSSELYRLTAGMSVEPHVVSHSARLAGRMGDVALEMAAAPESGVTCIHAWPLYVVQ